jgi:hypothetical protein
MGDALFFSFWNPSGYYKLNLANEIEREIAMTLLVLSKEVSLLVSKALCADRS